MTGVFETQTLRVCPTEPIICVKEDLLRKSPNKKYMDFHIVPILFTFLNANNTGKLFSEGRMEE